MKIVKQVYLKLFERRFPWENLERYSETTKPTSVQPFVRRSQAISYIGAKIMRFHSVTINITIDKTMPL